MYLYINKNFRRDKTLFVCLLCITTFKIILSILNAYVFTIYGADADAIVFVEHARRMVQNDLPIRLLTTGSAGYENFLAFIFKYTGISTFTAQNLSIIISLISLHYLIKMSFLIGKGMFIVPIALLFSIVPSSIIYTSIAMREPYQILFLILSVYYLLLILLRSGLSVILFLKFSLSALLLGMLHNGLLIFALFLLLLVLSSLLPKKLGNYKYAIFLLSAFIFMPMVFQLLNSLNISTGATDALMKGDFTNYIESYRDGGIRVSGGAAYNTVFDTSTITSMLLSLPLVVLNYMFAPMPWQVRGGIDLIAIVENTIRLTLLFGAIHTFRQFHAGDPLKRIYKYTLLIYLGVELLWALGTVNWGTAIRHHLVSYGIILLLGVDWLMNFLKQMLTRT